MKDKYDSLSLSNVKNTRLFSCLILSYIVEELLLDSLILIVAFC